MQKNIKISIIIVHYKRFDLLLSCINLIYKSKTKANYEIVVVDNDERKTIGRKLKRKYPKVIYVKSSGNIGYGAGNNLGARRASGDYLLIMNPDTLIYPGAVMNLVSFLEKNKDVAVAAPNFYHKNGKLFEYQGSRTLTPVRAVFALSFINKYFPNNPVSKKYYLKDLNFDEERQVNSVPGSCFLIKKNVFEKVGGFDENFYLYFEEADIFKRIGDIGYKLYMIPRTKVVHMHKQNTPKSKWIDNMFNKSRFMYFKKHFGLPIALIVEGFLRFSKQHLLLLTILSLATFLRLYKIREAFTFNGEIGDNLLDIKDYYLNRQLPLVGPPTSHPWLYFGPIYYWIYGPILVFSGFNPLSHAYFGASVSVLTVFVNYVFTKKYWGEKVALLSTLLIAASPLYLALSFMARFFNFVALLIYPFIYFLIEFLKGRNNYMFWMFFVLGVMFSFHYTPIILVPAVYLLIFKSKIKLTLNLIKKLTIGLTLPLLPLFIYDAENRFVMFTKLLLWIPYRIAGFAGIIPKNNLTFATLTKTIDSFVEYMGFLFIPKSFVGIYPHVSILLIITIVYYLIRSKMLRERKLIYLPVVIVSVGFIPLFIHGEPPFHYFIPLLPFIPLILSIYVFKIIKNSNLRKIFIFGFVLLAVINTADLINMKNEFIQNESKALYYNVNHEVAEAVVNDASGDSVWLRRVGGLDEYEGDFAQNYQYLMWWFGNEPVKVGSVVVDGSKKPKVKYFIYEDISQLSNDFEDSTIWIKNVAILKEEL
jgi:GT2 family glycosyltransferase